MDELPHRLRGIFSMLREIEPLSEEYDVVWNGPYYIPRRRQWCPSRFLLYDGTLYASLFIPPRWHGLSWKVGSDDVTFERGFEMGGIRLDDWEWAQALEQIEKRLRSASRNFEAYNARVERLLPPACRTGSIERRLTWPRDAPPPLPPAEIERFDDAVTSGERRPFLERMTLSAYLDTVGVAYDAVFEDLRPLSPMEKYRRRADGRHGGLLDLPPDDAKAFETWFHGDDWRGTHPWEIVFGHPHGIMIAPRRPPDVSGWRYSLWVDSEGWYATAARMAVALDAAAIPYEAHDAKKVADALRGVDAVRVGADLYSVRYETLEEERPDVLSSIRWDPIPSLRPISSDQRARVLERESPRSS